MKLVFALITAAVAAQPHVHHAHQQFHEKRQQGSPTYDVSIVPGPTVVVYELNGQMIPESEVQEGINNGTLVWASNGQISSVASSAPATSAPPPPPSSSSSYVAPTTAAPATSSDPAPAPSSSSAPASSSMAAPVEAIAAPPSGGPSNWGASGSKPWGGSSSGGDDSDFSSDSSTGLDEEFPDGQIDCSTFPSEYGAVPVQWMGLGGWIGVQQPGSTQGGFGNILTVTSGGACTEDSYCSYSCPAGYQKSQWPSTQGATGQSVGGLLCQGGKLHLTNPSLSKNLCMTGTQQVNVMVKNELSQNVAICRTDYPGTEAETVPLNVQPGASSNLTCPDAGNYYYWEGGQTSAQYYVNPAGVSVSDACQWGSSANPWGNYAPMNLGVGFTGGAAWLGVFQNSPTTDVKLDFAIEVQGDSMSGTCKYSNGQWCSLTGCNDGAGCTVSATSGTVTFVFTDS